MRPPRGALSDGNGDSISYSQITTTASTLTSATALPAPVLTNGTSANVVLTAPATKVITQDAKWTFAYANTAVGADRYVRRREHQQQPSGVHRHDAVTLRKGRCLRDAGHIAIVADVSARS